MKKIIITFISLTITGCVVTAPGIDDYSVTRQQNTLAIPVDNISDYYIESIIIEYRLVQEHMIHCSVAQNNLLREKQQLLADRSSTNQNSLIVGGGSAAAAVGFAIIGDEDPISQILAAIFGVIAGISSFVLNIRSNEINTGIINIDKNYTSINEVNKEINKISIYLNNREYLKSLTIQDQKDILTKLKEVNDALNPYCNNITRNEIIPTPSIPSISTPNPSPTLSPSPSPTASTNPIPTATATSTIPPIEEPVIQTPNPQISSEPITPTTTPTSTSSPSSSPDNS
jgi:hypothetical protein